MMSSESVHSLHTLQGVLGALLPAAAAEPSASTSKEAQRLELLHRAAAHLLALPLAEGADDDQALQALTTLQARAGALLQALGEHLRAELPAALQRAAQHWDQAGNVQLLGPDDRQSAVALQGEATQQLQALTSSTQRSPAQVALLLGTAEVVLALDAAFTLVRAVEMRFAPLLRARLRQQEGAPAEAALLPGGAPFFDLAGPLLALAHSFRPGAGGENDQ